MDRAARIVAEEGKDMTDRELLEFAAKAAGIHALRSPDGVLRNCTGLHPAMNMLAAPPWNPLTDDGDALRLAVKLGLLVDVWLQQKVCIASTQGEELVDAREQFGDDPYAATRRAIVRAAAEIGRNMT
jgi:hypothetical protein